MILFTVGREIVSFKPDKLFELDSIKLFKLVGHPVLINSHKFLSQILEMLQTNHKSGYYLLLHYTVHSLGINTNLT